jgi:AmpD protein
LPPGEFAGNGVIELFTNRINPEICHHQNLHEIKVSAHFFIRRNGEIIQFVPCGKRAWHAGVSCWQGKTCCNDFSIGVEIEGSDTVPFTASQYVALVTLTIELSKAYPIVDITGHSDIAPERKTDPGPYFDWKRYREALLIAKQS